MLTLWNALGQFLYWIRQPNKTFWCDAHFMKRPRSVFILDQTTKQNILMWCSLYETPYVSFYIGSDNQTKHSDVMLTLWNALCQFLYWIRQPNKTFWCDAHFMKRPMSVFILDQTTKQNILMWCSLYETPYVSFYIGSDNQTKHSDVMLTLWNALCQFLYWIRQPNKTFWCDAHFMKRPMSVFILDQTTKQNILMWCSLYETPYVSFYIGSDNQTKHSDVMLTLWNALCQFLYWIRQPNKTFWCDAHFMKRPMSVFILDQTTKQNIPMWCSLYETPYVSFYIGSDNQTKHSDVMLTLWNALCQFLYWIRQPNKTFRCDAHFMKRPMSVFILDQTTKQNIPMWCSLYETPYVSFYIGSDNQTKHSDVMLTLWNALCQFLYWIRQPNKTFWCDAHFMKRPMSVFILDQTTKQNILMWCSLYETPYVSFYIGSDRHKIFCKSLMLKYKFNKTEADYKIAEIFFIFCFTNETTEVWHRCHMFLLLSDETFLSRFKYVCIQCTGLKILHTTAFCTHATL